MYVSLNHVKLAEDDLEFVAPDLEVSQLFDGGLLGRKHQDDILLVVLANDHLHVRVCSIKTYINSTHHVG